MRSIQAEELFDLGKRLIQAAEAGELFPGRGPSPDVPMASQNQCSIGQAVDPDHILKELFTYHTPDQEQQKQYETVRDAALHLARVILKNSPPGPDRTAAVRKLRECVMTANAAIALRGLSL